MARFDGTQRSSFDRFEDANMRDRTVSLLGAPLLLLIANVLHAGPYRDAVLEDSPLAYWTFDETNLSDPALPLGLLDGAGVADGQYSSDGLQLGQPTLVAGEAGSSLRLFDNGRMMTEPFEKLGDVFGFGGTGYSVELWTSLERIPNGFTNLVGDGEPGLNFNLMLYAGSGGFVRPHSQTIDGFASIDSVDRLQPNQIFHIVSTWDADSGDMFLYLDGAEVDVNTSAGSNPNPGDPANTANPIFIGQDNREPRTPQGWIDEVAIYNYALSPDRVLAHFNIGQGATPPEVPQGPPPPPSVNISLSSDVVGRGTFADGYSSENGMVNIIRQIPNQAAANIVAYTADEQGPTVDVGEWIVDGGTAGGLGSNEHGRGGNLWIPGDGEANTAHDGFGGHANWMMTFDVEEIRAQRLGDATGDLRLTGRYGSWGGIGNADPNAGVTQGLIFIDGVRADNLNETTHNEPSAGGVDSPSQSFDITVPADAKFVSLGLMSGPGSTFWDDGVFRNVRLRVADPALDAQEGLVSYWSFDESDSGTDTVQDQPGGNHGDFEVNVERTAGLIGSGAAQFTNTAGDAVNVGSGEDNNFSFDTGLTIEAVFQSEWFGGDYDEFFRKEDGGNRLLLSFQDDNFGGGANPPVDPGPVLSFGLNIDGYGELDMPLDGEDGRPTPEDLADGETHHVAATYDSETGEKAIWIDGEKLWSVDLGAGSLITSGGPAEATIGNVGPGAGEPFSGILDEVAIWNRGLSADEIASHWQNVLAGRSYFSGGQAGDFDGDGQLTVADIDLLRIEIQSGNNSAPFDLNSDGSVDNSDILVLVTSPETLNSFIGDSNLDSEFNSGDLVTVFTAGKFESGEAANWSEGDWNGDGVFDSGDLVFAFTDGGFEQGPRAINSVPEPSGWIIAILGSFIAWPRVRSKSTFRV